MSAHGIFSQPELAAIVSEPDGMPRARLPEVALTGRSNVGKSSLLNALLGRRDMARVSNTPGRTRQLFFFSLSARMMLVDMPGYGYAKAGKKDVEGWNRLIHDYLKGRSQLRRVMLLIDSRHGIKPNDEQIMKELDETAVVYQAVLTKTDKISAKALADVLADTQARVKARPAAFPDVIATSSETRDGIDALRAAISSLL